MEITRGDRAVAWIEQHCVDPEGKPVTLTGWQQDELRRLFDALNSTTENN